MLFLEVDGREKPHSLSGCGVDGLVELRGRLDGRKRFVPV
jgi:hypothetical protein